MSSTYISASLRKKIAEDAGFRCGYCLTAQEFTAMPMHIEHIIPLAANGETVEDNLWLACPLCNGYKATKIGGIDVQSGQEVPLFNPRHQLWQEHFQWDSGGVKIVGITPIGRVTVVALNLNNEHFMRARRRWVLAGWHPPS